MNKAHKLLEEAATYEDALPKSLKRRMLVQARNLIAYVNQGLHTDKENDDMLYMATVLIDTVR